MGTLGDTTQSLQGSLSSLTSLSPSQIPSSSSRLELVFPLVAQGSRTVANQALCQLCALPLTLLMATVGGCITGEIWTGEVGWDGWDEWDEMGWDGMG